MTLSRALSAVVIGISALSMGCSDSLGQREMYEAPDLDDPLFSSMAGLSGTGGTNNLKPNVFHVNKGYVYNSTKSALAALSDDEEQWWLADTADMDALLAPGGPRKVLDYAVRCALSTTSTVYGSTSSGGVSFTGEGIVTTTSAWKTTALGLDHANDLFTCMIAHMNANNVEVPINLSGPHVTNSPDGDDAFSWEEALWVVSINANDPQNPVFNLHVWPMGTLTECTGYVTGLTDRICGNYTGACGLTIRTDRDDACTETAAGWECEDTTGHPLPAILTRLKNADVDKFYAGCQ